MVWQWRKDYFVDAAKAYTSPEKHRPELRKNVVDLLKEKSDDPQQWAWLRYDSELKRLVAQSSITKTDNRATVNVFDRGD